MRATILVVALGVAISGLLARDAGTRSVSATVGRASPNAPRWVEVKWPFPLDQWGLGRAFRCAAADCGFKVSLYLRPKVGFCNCTTGVSDDEELERVGDLDLLGQKFAAIAKGHAVSIGRMKGRSRLYTVTRRDAPALSAVSIGFNDQCDAAIATVVADRERLTDAERLAVSFLNGDLVLRWAKAELNSNGI